MSHYVIIRTSWKHVSCTHSATIRLVTFQPHRSNQQKTQSLRIVFTGSRAHFEYDKTETSLENHPDQFANESISPIGEPVQKNRLIRSERSDRRRRGASGDNRRQCRAALCRSDRGLCSQNTEI